MQHSASTHAHATVRPGINLWSPREVGYGSHCFLLNNVVGCGATSLVECMGSVPTKICVISGMVYCVDLRQGAGSQGSGSCAVPDWIGRCPAGRVLRNHTTPVIAHQAPACVIMVLYVFMALAQALLCGLPQIKCKACTIRNNDFSSSEVLPCSFIYLLLAMGTD